MNKRDLLILGMLSLSMVAVSGCAQKMAKSDTAPAETASGAADSTQAATPATLPNPMTDSSAAASSDTTIVADATPAKDAKPKATAGTKASKDAAATKQAAALLPLPPQDITNTIHKLTHLHRVRYLSRTGQYEYYVGGRLDAKYDINHNQLIVTNAGDNNGTPVTCQYSKDGKMIGDGKAASQKVVGECNNLVNELGKYLAR